MATIFFVNQQRPAPKIVAGFGEVQRCHGFAAHGEITVKASLIVLQDLRDDTKDEKKSKIDEQGYLVSFSGEWQRDMSFNR